MNSTMQLWDWRRKVADLYAAIRAEPDPLTGWRMWRAARDALYTSHPQTPIEPEALPGFTGVAMFDHDPALRFLVDLAPAEGSELLLPAGEDGEVHAMPFAETRGLASSLGGELTLYWLGGYGCGVFLPFADATSGRESYGGGRYVLDTIKGADLGHVGSRLVVDFNFAYAPSCAHSQRYVCPLAPARNRLPGAVRAGEREG